MRVLHISVLVELDIHAQASFSPPKLAIMDVETPLIIHLHINICARSTTRYTCQCEEQQRGSSVLPVLNR